MPPLAMLFLALRNTLGSSFFLIRANHLKQRVQWARRPASGVVPLAAPLPQKEQQILQCLSCLGVRRVSMQLADAPLRRRQALAVLRVPRVQHVPLGDHPLVVVQRCVRDPARCVRRPAPAPLSALLEPADEVRQRGLAAPRPQRALKHAENRHPGRARSVVFCPCAVRPEHSECQVLQLSTGCSGAAIHGLDQLEDPLVGADLALRTGNTAAGTLAGLCNEARQGVEAREAATGVFLCGGGSGSRGVGHGYRRSRHFLGR
ncbi:hypothetical protein F4775DRAFT_50899 [Biscogniauxia sp. FL1348]|nr:hypothetical protein F4775DRAFT_50899 [Biscogniauxia sp. FL1348]